jgi:nucleotide-binding universal stress UspA family protein
LQESGANLVVMGTHGRGGVPRLVFGSVTEAVMRVATAPVIAVNAGTTESGSVSRILCPVNFTDACRAALRQAVALLDGPDAPILLFHALEGKELQPSINELIRLHEWAPPEIAGRCELKTMPSRAPVEAILDLALATAADLIVLDVAPGRSLYESLRGTVAERIVQASHCPVLTMNAFAARALQSAGSVRELALA